VGQDDWDTAEADCAEPEQGIHEEECDSGAAGQGSSKHSSTSPDNNGDAVAFRTRRRLGVSTSSLSGSTSTSSSRSGDAYNNSIRMANPYSRDAFLWGAAADAQMRLEAFDNTPVAAVISEKYFSSEGMVKYKVQLQGLPLNKAVYVDANDVPAPVMQAWQGTKAPPSFYCKVGSMGHNDNTTAALLPYFCSTASPHRYPKP
jgi:hypothetical protein